jgi:hypothetical protein
MAPTPPASLSGAATGDINHPGTFVANVDLVRNNCAVADIAVPRWASGEVSRGLSQSGGAVLGERDRREWAGIERDLAAEKARGFTAVSV